jgi:hypothetical protein
MDVTEFRDHPDYEAGYFDRWYSRKPRPALTPPYTAGWEAAAHAIDIFKSAGMTETSPGLYTKTVEVGSTFHRAPDTEETQR